MFFAFNKYLRYELCTWLMIIKWTSTLAGNNHIQNSFDELVCPQHLSRSRSNVSEREVIMTILNRIQREKLHYTSKVLFRRIFFRQNIYLKKSIYQNNYAPSFDLFEIPKICVVRSWDNFFKLFLKFDQEILLSTPSQHVLDNLAFRLKFFKEILGTSSLNQKLKKMTVKFRRDYLRRETPEKLNTA